MEVQARYAPKSECFARVYERFGKLGDESFTDYVKDEIAQFSSQAKDRSEWEYVIRARIWDHVVRLLVFLLVFSGGY